MLAAWLCFVLVASIGPFLVFGLAYEPGGRGAWVASGGGVYRWSIDRTLGAQIGEPHSTVRWEPSTTNWSNFASNRLNLSYVRPSTTAWVIGAPPWTFLLAPTLLFLGTTRIRRSLHHRQMRRERRLGRTPCAACGYDTTGLAACPECGASNDAPEARSCPDPNNAAP